jgi:hypothetical protein
MKIIYLLFNNNLGSLDGLGTKSFNFSEPLATDNPELNKIKTIEPLVIT